MSAPGASIVHQASGSRRAREFLIVATAALVAAASTPVILSLVTQLGGSIMSADVASDYVKALLWAMLLGASISLWPATRSERRALGVLWCAKCLVTLGVMLLYESHYGLDSFGYFEASKDRAVDWNAVSTGNGTVLMNTFAWLHAHLVVDSFHAIKVTCAMLGLIALFLLYRSACVVMGRSNSHWLLLLGFVPSVLFWSSILGKDPVVLLGISLYAHGLTHWLQKQEKIFLPTAVAGLFLASALRFWLAPILLAPLGVVAFFHAKGVLRKTVVLAIGAVLGALIIARLGQQFAIAAVVDGLDALNSNAQAWAEGGSAQVIASDLRDPVQLLKFIPRGMSAALFRPLPGEVNNAFGLLAGLENMLLVGLTLFAVWRSRLADFRKPAVLWAAAFVIVWGVVYGPISYQNLGTAVRFRLQVLPIMVLVLIYLARPHEKGARHALPQTI